MTRTRRTCRLAAALLSLISIAVVAPAHADAYSGVLGVKTVGTGYGGTDASGLDYAAWVVRTGSPGSQQTFALEIVNNGTETRQYQFELLAGASESPVVTAGSTNITDLALYGTGPGYVTPPIAPGKVQTLTIKLTVPQGLPPDSLTSNLARLYSVGLGTFFGSDELDVQSAGPAVTGATSMQITANGQPRTNAFLYSQATYPTVMNAATISATSTATFTLSLKNTGKGPAAVTLSIAFPALDCSAASFVPTMKFGSTDITQRAESVDGYSFTGGIAAGATKTVTFTVKALAPKPDFSTGCANREGYVITDSINNNDLSTMTWVEPIVNAV
jgi:hypothetical protein